MPAAPVRRPPTSSRTAGGPGGDHPASAPHLVHAAQRQELLRALAAVALSTPPLCGPAARSLGIGAPDPGEHTGVFVLSAPPHAAIYLGGEGKLGGEALDRVAGFWRVLGLTPPSDADHLGTLLLLAAELGDAAAGARSPGTATALARARSALVWEHLWSWAPAYLGAVERLGTPVLGPWARLTLAALASEVRAAGPPALLPLALRSAPPPLGTAQADGRDGLLDALLAPARSGIILTREDLRAAAESIGAGCRMGERRYTLAALVDQEPAAVLAWLDGFARRWARWHRDQPAARPSQPGRAAADQFDPRSWWAERAAATARAVAALRRELIAG